MQATQHTQDNNKKLCGVPVELDCKNPDCQEADPSTTDKHSEKLNLGPSPWAASATGKNKRLKSATFGFFRPDATILTTCQ